LPPLVIGIVGSSRSGKSHLLAAMIAEIVRGGLQPYHLTFAPLDHRLHDRYMQEKAKPLVVDSERLAPTPEAVVRFADGLLITSPAGTRPVVFFDVAGGALLERGLTGRFLLAANGLIFVVDPGTAPGMDPPADPVRGQPTSDPAFDNVLARLGA